VSVGRGTTGRDPLDFLTASSSSDGMECIAAPFFSWLSSILSLYFLDTLPSFPGRLSSLLDRP
jgi:hypothetical protein